MEGGAGFYTIVNFGLEELFSVNWGVFWNETGEGVEENYIYWPDTQKREEITADEAGKYFLEAEIIEFTPIPFTGTYSSKTDLSKYMGTNIYEMVAKFEDLQEEGSSDGTIGFSNEYLSFQAEPWNSAGPEAISLISIDGDCDFSIKGIEYGMSYLDACRLLKSDSSLTTDGSPELRHVSFHMDNGIVLLISSDNNSKVASVSMFVN